MQTQTLSSSAMLVELSISKWGGYKLDKAASKDVTKNSNAVSGIARVNKQLLGSCPTFKAIKQMDSSIRTMHYGMTMPWSDMGMRLLPTKQYFKYHKEMSGMQDQFALLVDAFLADYNTAIANAQDKLGALFNPNDYPSREQIRQKFDVKIAYVPLPDAGDFRLDITNDGLREVQDHYKTYYEQQLNSAMNDIWKRVYKALTNMSDRLDYSDENKKNKKIFHDTLVSNVTDLIELLDTCNVTGNSQMAAMADSLDQTLRGVTPQALRTSSHLRAKTKRSIDIAIKNLPSLG